MLTKLLFPSVWKSRQSKELSRDLNLSDEFFSTNFPRKGEIWTAKTDDGYTSYRVIIRQISHFEGDVHYSPLNTGITHVASEQLFLSIYRKDPDQCLTPPPLGKTSSFKTLWQKVRAFFSA